MSAVLIRALHKAFPGRRRQTVRVLDGVDLDVPSGSLVAVLGPSGCGKTTLLRIVAGFERADAGEVLVGGRTVAGSGVHVPPERRRVGVVPQEQALFPHLTVARNVGFGLPRGAGSAARVDELLELAGLAGLADRMPHELSGGQQQRVALARALAPAPSVVLLDEPFGGLDAALRGVMREEVRRILRGTGATAVLVTHDQEEALSMSDRVAVMRAGRVVQAGSPEEVYRAPVDLGVATFVGDATVLDGTAEGGTVETVLGRLPVGPAAATGRVHVVIRPEQLELGAAGVEGTVVDRSYFGHDALLRVRLDSGAEVDVRTPAVDVAGAGERVRVGCRGAVLAFPAVPGA